MSQQQQQAHHTYSTCVGDSWFYHVLYQCMFISTVIQIPDVWGPPGLDFTAQSCLIWDSLDRRVDLNTVERSPPKSVPAYTPVSSYNSEKGPRPSERAQRGLGSDLLALESCGANLFLFVWRGTYIAASRFPAWGKPLLEQRMLQQFGLGVNQNSHQRHLLLYIAEQFNSPFVNAGRPSTSNCQYEDQVLMRASSSLNKLKSFVSKTSKASESFQIPLASTEFVYTQLKSLKTNKAKGIDDIGPYFLKMAADIISPPLCYVLNTSIITGIFPSSWILAKVISLYKKGKSDNIENYRTHCLFYRKYQNYWRHISTKHFINTWHVDADLLVPHQSGFRPQHSCTTLL